MSKACWLARQIRSWTALVAVLGVACGAAQAETATADDATGEDGTATSETSPGGPKAASDANAKPTRPDAAREGRYETARHRPREIRYLVKPDGLQIDIGGARFRPRASATRVAGGWGVRVEVEASSQDDATHSLLSDQEGALAFAGRTKRRGKEERFADERRGGEEQLLFPGAPVMLTRDWPGTTGTAALRSGDEIALEVGLWGLGDDADSRRPVAKFFLVTMKVGAKSPEPRVTTPDGM